MEIWRKIDQYNGRYFISSYVRVFSLLSNKILTPYVDKDGYEIVGLYLDGKQKKEKIHRLVAKQFVENPEGYDQVNHIDENKRNNNMHNLEWCNCQYNINYGLRNKKVSEAIKSDNQKKRRRIICLDRSGKVVKIYPSLRSVDMYGYNHGAVYRVCSGNGKYKSHKGYIWQYYDKYIENFGTEVDSDNELPQHCT